MLTVRNITTDRTIYDDTPGLGRLLFVFHLSGTRQLELEDETHHRFEEPSMRVLYQPAGIKGRSIWERGTSDASVVLGVWPTQMPAGLVLPIENNPQWPNFAGEKKSALLAECHLSFEMEQAVRMIMSPRVHSDMLLHYLHTKSNELLCTGITAMYDTVAIDQQIAHSNRYKISRAKELVDQSLRRPPTVAGLARAVSMPASQFARAFKADTGVNLSEYVLVKRMTKARLLLETTPLRIKQIAYDVGYNHASNFCIAFKRFSGMTPKEVRQRAGPRPI